MSGTRRVVEFDADEALYLGDGDDGVYYQSAEGRDGLWYVTVVVDSNTGGFVDNIYTDNGPHGSEEDANEFGENAAIDWCITNDVEYDGTEAENDDAAA